MQVFVKNTGRYDATFTALEKVSAKDQSGKEVLVDKKLFTKTFATHSKDPSTGRVVSTGYTAIEEDDYKKLLTSCKLFAASVKNGTLVKYGEAPADALLDTQLLEKLSAENKALKSRVAELEKQLVTGGAKAVAEAKPAKSKKADDTESPEF
jgi:hypothetical protein